MPKKSSKQLNHREMVHFRPGEELGRLLSEMSAQSGISRGEAAKRCVSLAIRGLDLDLYAYAESLIELLYGNASFDEAVHHLHVAIHERAVETGQDVSSLNKDERIEAVKALIDSYRFMRGHEEKVEHQRISIRLVNTPETRE